jgi:hypothetical protein
VSARLGAAAIIAIAVSGAWLWSRARAAAPTSTSSFAAAHDDDREERKELRAEVRRLGMENLGLRLEKARRDADGAVAAAPATEAAPAPDLPPPTPELEARWLMARAALLDEALESQPRDDKWASPLEEKARATYPDKADGATKLVSVSCRSSACRMEFTYRDGAARAEHIRHLGQDFGELPRVSYAYPGEPTVHNRAIMYMAADGHELPQLDYATFSAPTSP